MAEMNETNWQSIMNGYGLASNRESCLKLIRAHAGRGRYYHTAEHISACLRYLEDVKEQAEDWKSMALAFWFHDAIYKPFSSTNERESADWAVKFLRSNQASQHEILRVERLIMATVHNAADLSGDVALFVDIDLSILGAPWKVYKVYENNIRKEYRWVPKPIYRKKRAALLQTFLERPNIFGTEYFREKWEVIARENLSRAIEMLNY